MAGVVQPGAVLQHADPGRGEVAHLRGQLAGLLAAVVEAFRQLAVEEQDRLAHRHAVLGAAEAQHLDAGLPGQLGRRRAEEGAGVGEARAVHVQVQPEFATGLADRAQLIRAVDGADLGGLGDGDHPRLGIVDVLALEGDLADRLRGQLALLVGTRQQQLGAVGEEFRRAALVGLDVGGLGADHAVVALAQRGQGQGVGGGAVEGEEHFAVGFEQVAEIVGRAGGPLVLAVGALVAVVGLGHRRPGFRADAGIVVAGELLGVVGHEGCLWNG
ncbi:hypothetical protein D9M71_364490 [compost metagenome]